MTAPIPAEAIDRAGRAIYKALYPDGRLESNFELAHWKTIAEQALQAALPHLTAAIADEIETARRKLPDDIPNTLHTAMRSADDCSWAMAQSRDIAYYFGRS